MGTLPCRIRVSACYCSAQLQLLLVVVVVVVGHRFDLFDDQRTFARCQMRMALGLKGSRA